MCVCIYLFIFTCRPVRARPFLKRPLTQPGHIPSDSSASASALVYSCIFSKQKERLPNSLSETAVRHRFNSEVSGSVYRTQASYLNSVGLYLIASVKYLIAVL